MSLPKHLTLEVVTPERLLVREVVDEVVLPGMQGELGILPGHTPLLATLKTGVLSYRKGDQRRYLAVSQGFAEALPDRVTVLAQVAERAEDIDVGRAAAARQRSDDRLAKAGPETDLLRAQASRDKALVRLHVAQKSRERA
jgi:F-type H+-transporting ATPase subunit epsilon